jgi:2-polyprenyl-3-methyl-5-hydroxy-6-metoxy-1,4-benzoquinol methylase
MKNASKLYDEYYKDVEKSAPFTEEMEGDKSFRRSVALDYFEKYGAKKVLDAGCGPGFDSRYFHKKGFDVHACDVSGNALKFAKTRNPGPRYFQWDIGKRPVKAKFDGVFAFELIEHLFDYDAFLSNLRTSMKSGGILVLTTPNVLAPRNRIKLLLGNDEWFESKYHIHFFSPKTLCKALERNGFKVLQVSSKGSISFLGPNFGGSLTAVAKNE